MATLSDWNAYINLTHEMALIENDLREIAETDFNSYYVERILFERFGLDTYQ